MTAANDDRARAPTVKTTIENGCVIERPILRPNGLDEIDEKEAARYLRMSVKTLYNMRMAGTAPKHKVRRGRYWYLIADLRAHIEAA